jgi:farnesyl diphosphate synthase/geranylgeranyl diphosphate synthase type II
MTESSQATSLGELLAPCAQQVEEDLRGWLVEPDTPETLAEAMRYCTLNGGKRLRPALVLMTGLAVGSEVDELLRRAAVAVELIHSYSLVHDDLPAMDDDDLRRGRPTAHVQFGEALAILAGDALLTRAPAVLAETGDPRAPSLVAELCRGAGATGMIAGQVADMDLCDVPGGMDGVEYVHHRKTAALIQSAVRMGALCARCDEPTLTAVSQFGRQIGRAFQTIDDLLDVVGSAGELGKAVGKDADAGKRSPVALLGVDQTRRLARDMTTRATAALEPLGSAADPLAELARLLAQRTY